MVKQDKNMNNNNRYLSKSFNQDLNQKPNREELFYPYQSLFDSFFDSFFSDLSPNALKSKTGFPRWDIYQTDTDWIIEVSATGCEPKDINIEIVPSKEGEYKNILRISGRISEDHQLSDNVKYFSARELRRSAFERSVYLPNDIKGEPEATMKNGILTLKWKLPEKEKTTVKKIQIKILDS
jgi:HSP20 family molecular chaperone IbpA